MQGSIRQTRPARWTRVTLLAALAVLAGCRTVSRLPVMNSGPAAPTVLAPTSTAEQVIATVNANTARVQSYSTNNASISIPGLPHLPLLQGNIAYQRPQRFRFQARALTGPEVDFGSNDERFWLWARQMKDQNGQAPLYTVRHDQYATSAARGMMPIEPQWIIEALGLITIDPATTQAPMPQADGGLQLRSTINSPRGVLTRVLVVDPHGWVTQQSIVDPQGALLASATAEQFYYDPQMQVSLPRVVTIRVPAAELALRIDTGRATLNRAAGDPNRLYQPPALPGHPVIDLGASGPVAQSAPPGPPVHVAAAEPMMKPLKPVTQAAWSTQAVDPAVNGFAAPTSVPTPLAPQAVGTAGVGNQGLPPGGVALP